MRRTRITSILVLVSYLCLTLVGTGTVFLCVADDHVALESVANNCCGTHAHERDRLEYCASHCQDFAIHFAGISGYVAPGRAGAEKVPASCVTHPGANRPFAGTASAAFVLQELPPTPASCSLRSTVLLL